MSNFPSKWFDFINNKELRRLRKDLKDTFELKLQLASSIILAIISFNLDLFVESCNTKGQILICAALCVTVIGIFAFPFVIKRIRLMRRCNVIIEGKDAVSIFDDEIVYSVLVACEYYNAKKMIPDTELSKDVTKFYDIEIEYYVTESMKRLTSFSSNAIKLFGEGKNRISLERVKNIINLIDKLVLNASLQLNDDLLHEYLIFCQLIEKFPR